MTTSIEPATTTQQRMNTVPQVTLLFWMIKMMSTTVGETLADSLNVNLHLGLTGVSLLMGILLIVSLAVQLLASTYQPVRYWMAVVLVSIFGTLVTDNLTDNLGVPLAASTAGFAIALGIAFTVWYRTEKTLSIQTIVTLRQSLFYWTAILLTFALGTALGDWIAEGIGMGYAKTAILFTALLMGVAATRWLPRMNTVFCFWLAYVLTRPLGASYGDLLSQPVAQGGLGFGVNAVSLVFVVLIVGMVWFLSRSTALSRLV
ncbi:MAG: hypothetical protein RLY58_1215 [Pseudomonadota bacterium]|jgi:uncharacterized membrane-anchored protein